MTDFRLTRREFVKGCCSAALVSGAGTSLMFADDAIAAANSHDTVVHLFLRGGIDGLNLVVPVSGGVMGKPKRGTSCPKLMLFPISGLCAAAKAKRSGDVRTQLSVPFPPALWPSMDTRSASTFISGSARN